MPCSSAAVNVKFESPRHSSASISSTHIFVATHYTSQHELLLARYFDSILQHTVCNGTCLRELVSKQALQLRVSLLFPYEY